MVISLVSFIKAIIVVFRVTTVIAAATIAVT